ncbi:MAG: hypothetical protein HYX67_04545 [Candidatus Melainabacteria bacterium]|nr:hypothetical protein [Candidatus Melainabacteria bacterium]
MKAKKKRMSLFCLASFFIFIMLSGIGNAQTKTTVRNGRLCNQIFRNLCVSFIAQKHNLSVDYSNFNTIQSLGIDLFVGTLTHPYTIKLDDDNFFAVLNSDHLTFELYANDNYFQTKEISNYIFEYLHQENIKQHIVDVNTFKERYNRNNDCFIHVRLTDTERYNPGTQYYLKALSLISYDNLYISSDDFTNDIIKGIIDEHKNAVLLFNCDEVKTIQFASTCKNIILSHGSFSAIIGYLSFFSDIYYKKYEQDKIWYGDMFSIPKWNMIE